MIAAVVLGGTSLKGGKGTLIGTFSAVFLVSVLNEVLVSRGVDSAYQRIVLGLRPDRRPDHRRAPDPLRGPGIVPAGTGRIVPKAPATKVPVKG